MAAWLAVGLLLLAIGSARADVFTVNNIGDDSDFDPGDGVCDITPLLRICTLRAAIEEANALLNVDLDRDIIEFDIIPSGVYTIQPVASELPSITEAVVIDGTTQDGSVPNTDPDAFNAVVAIEIDGTTLGPGLGTGLTAASLDVEIKGVAIRHFDVGVSFGGQGRLEGCVIEDNSGDGVSLLFTDRNVIGGGFPFTANVISGNGHNGINISGVDNIANGNLIGTDPSGTVANGNSTASDAFAGITDEGTGTVIVRNLVSGQSGAPGILVTGTDGIIQENRVGTDANGVSVLGNREGISLAGTGYQVGGAPTQGNVVGGNSLAGITMSGSFNQVQGNFIGATRLAGSDIGNIGPGIRVFGSDNLIGGSFRGNVIKFNDSGGIVVRFAERVEISSNLMFNNGGQFFPSIDLADPEGFISPNDPGDVDEGPNWLQNFPVLDAATRDFVTHIEGDFDSTPGDFTLQFYASRFCHQTGHGEGEQLLGTRTITLPGDASFAFDFPGAIGPIFTAIATDEFGNSSEWSPCLAVAGGGTADLGVEKELIGGDVGDPDELVFQIRVTNPGPLAAINAVVEDALPPGLGFVSADPAETSSVGGTVTWNLGTVDVDEIVVLDLTADVAPGFLQDDVMCGGYTNDFVNMVSVQNDQLDLNPENDEAEAMIAVRTGGDLSIQLTPSRQAADPPANAFLTVTVRNDGPEDAFGVMATGTAPGIDCSSVPAFDPCDSATGGWMWLVGDLAAGSAMNLGFSLAPSALLGEVTSADAMVMPTGDPMCLNNFSTAQIASSRTADLEVVGIDLDFDELEAMVSVRNNGPDEIDGISFETSVVPSSFVELAVLGPGEVSPSRFFRFAIGDVVSVTVTPVGNVGDGSGDLYDVFDPFPINNSRSQSTGTIGRGCGLGNVELVLLLPIGIWLARRRRSWR